MKHISKTEWCCWHMPNWCNYDFKHREQHWDKFKFCPWCKDDIELQETG